MTKKKEKGIKRYTVYNPHKSSYDKYVGRIVTTTFEDIKELAEDIWKTKKEKSLKSHGEKIQKE